MKRQRFQQSEQHLQNTNSQHQQQQGAREFASVEALLRHDVVHTPLPPTIEHRLLHSVGHLRPAPPRSWWRRWFGL